MKATAFRGECVESVFSRLKQFAEFKALCFKSRSDQESLVRLKRGKKVTESPSVVEQRKSKRGKHDDKVERAENLKFESSCRKGLKFALIHPKEQLSAVAPPEK